MGETPMPPGDRFESLRSLAKEDRRDGRREDPHVVPEGAPAQVRHVHADPFVESDAGAALDLPDAGQAGGDVEASLLPGLAGVALVARQRPRAYQRHVALEHVVKLRQLVDARFTQEAAEPGEPRAVFHLEGGAVLLALGCQFVALLLGARDHRAELVDDERTAAEARAALAED